MALAALVGLLAPIVAAQCDDAAVSAVHTTGEDRVLDVLVDTCNGDVSVDVEERTDRIVIRATHHDWYRFLFGRDDCLDAIRMELESPLGSRSVVDSSGKAIPVTKP